MVTYSSMPLTMPGSTIRTIATWGGTAELSMWSTPAPEENSTFSRGKAAMNSGGTCQAIR